MFIVNISVYTRDLLIFAGELCIFLLLDAMIESGQLLLMSS